ncbi:MAG: phosphoethanolamine transferase [Rheinheimera sp.]|uniref:phosphoethanolamine transferase n=1 Tax=Arsukibacterium sp. UBA3155 TaxID=1946058 RepID=UPI000C9447B9|nr:phosphoethanolamine--lipid A transferase [Arsukibacterium sp. UBA3155]MAD73666.1 phosphoethanolamine transferase [Rheinheimera sp.]|tara:strand:- start:232649 stop:234286 length:1638 start_codon:yes stop_codon:yes gene_type:complete
MNLDISISPTRLKVMQSEITRELLSISVALLLTLMFNQSFIKSILPLGGWQLSLPLMALLFLLNIFICQLFSIGNFQKVWLSTLIIIAAISQYFMQQYGVLLDKSMLINALETDSHEVTGLLSSAMLPYFVGYLLLPLALLFWIKPQQRSLSRSVKRYSALLFIVVALVSGLAASQYQNFAGVFRQHRYLKHQAVPLNALAAAVGVIQSKIAEGHPTAFIQYAEDAQIIPQANKPKLVIMVLGETLRADHLGINSYLRNTTPLLAQRDLINFGAIDACGTATAVSVPCLLSYLNKANYNDNLAKHSDNVLDVLARAGVKVIWRNNNSGCKSMCNRVVIDHSFADNSTFDCEEGACPDMALLHNLRQEIAQTKNDNQPIFVVLHQQGNHGPEYYKRSEIQHKHFLPECKSNLLSECQPQHIINAYDNAIVAADELLNSTISLLDGLSDEFDTAMLYVSDHGESLGENGVYLHGLPYWMAPDAQTKVPMLLWLSKSFTRRLALNTDCISQQKGLSHDYVFNSVLSLFEVTSSSKDARLDFIWPCTLS